MPACRIFVPAAVIAFAATTLLAAPASAQTPHKLDPDHAAKMAKGLDLFKKSVRPVLVEKCLKCHGGKKTEAALDLSDRATLLKGGESGPAVLIGKAADSLLVKLLRHEKDPKMPKSAAKLPADTVGQLAAWIDLGAPYDKPLIEKADPKAWTRKLISEDARQHWAYQPLKRVDPPAVRDAVWCRTTIDRFIRARQEASGISPNPTADRRKLIRRAYFDLIGLPPTPQEVEAFVNDGAADAWEKVIDRLLKSPHYGERWSRHWLDLVRFGESHGFEHDYDRPTAYHYRDFVIKALNDDLPYDTFVKWQLAGDEYAPDKPLAWMATGYLAAGVHSTQITKNEVERHRYDEMDDMLATTGTAMLGLTIGCCRCHDHKYDAFPQADYYRLLSTFTTTIRSEHELDVDPEGYRKAKAAFDREHAPYMAAVKQFEAAQAPGRRAELLRTWAESGERAVWAAAETLRPGGVKVAGLVQWVRTSDADWRKLKQRELDHLKQAPKPSLVKALVSSEGLPPVRLHTQGDDFLPQTHFLRRGDCAQKETVATQGFLQVLMRAGEPQRWLRAPAPGGRTSLRRTAFAEWLADVDYGAGRLLARVIVNRLWQHHLGRGIVATPSDFGTRGEPPTHPELLDWLASELIQPTESRGRQVSPWSLKHIHKLILTSAVYMQDSRSDDACIKADRDNKLYWRRPVQRLESEVLRDSLLAVSGMLDEKMFGPGTLDGGNRRRSIYFTVKRSKLMPMMVVFDAPEALVGVAERPATTIAPQALLLLNNPHVRAWAKSFAQRVAPDATTSTETAIRSAYLTALSRPPRAEELVDGMAFVTAQTELYRQAGKADARVLALTDFCQTVMCLNEFVFVE